MGVLMPVVVGASLALSAEITCGDLGRDHVLLQRFRSQSSVREVRKTSAAKKYQEPIVALDTHGRSTDNEHEHQMGWYSLFWCPPQSHQNEAYSIRLSGDSFVPALVSHPPGSEVVEQAIITIHGAPRETEGYFGDTVKIVHQQKKENSTLVVAPTWADKACSVVDWSSNRGAEIHGSAQAPYWTSLRRWMYGGPADNANSSSFEVLDSVVDWVQDNYPRLQRLVVTGFSAGAQLLSAGLRCRPRAPTV